MNEADKNINLNGNSNGDVTYFAQTNFRSERRSFGIKRDDRTKHMYIIGKTGMGKTTVLENMTIQDIQKGEGVGIVDPHGQFAEKMLNFIPENRLKDVVYFSPHDTDWPMAFNVMEDVGMELRHLVAAGLMGVFKKIWPDVWSARMEYILNNAILALLEYPDSTILGINRMLSDKDYRKEVVSKITDPVVKAFWEQEFARYTDRFMTEAGAAIQNKVGQFISNPLIRNIIGQPKSSFDIRKIMDEKKILIMNLSKGRIGESNAQLIGAMLITKIYLAAMSRVDVPEKERPDFYLYVDEFQNFATESFKDILSEARKYRLNLILAHQYIAQMDEKVRDAVFGNVGTLVIFRIGAFDAEVLEKEFSPDFMATDIVNLGFANIYLKLMINGVASRPFSAFTLPPIPMPEKSYTDEIIKFSREKYASQKEKVEKRIAEWHTPIIPPTGPIRTGTTTAKPERPATRQSEKTTSGPPLFEAVCSNCGVRTQVPFKPDGRRPVYCRDCKLEYLGKENVPQPSKARPSFAPPQNSFEGAPALAWRGRPSFDEGEIVQKSATSERISLDELKKRGSERKQKSGPDLGSLRKVLEETLDQAVKTEETKKSEQEDTDKNGNGKKTLHPG
ncbi:MAG: CxxC-x17-CxxC domain-containing protein, partial [Candidatus Tagabacteria bacterium]